MTKANLLRTTPPLEVETALQRLGANLKSARLRRNLTVAQVAEKIGTGPRAVADAEKGKPATAVATYFALLWAYDLLQQTDPLAAPGTDDVGHALADRRERARPRRRLDNDF
jgi:transcriptional regulator with XRE-family HTH domain